MAKSTINEKIEFMLQNHQAVRVCRFRIFCEQDLQVKWPLILNVEKLKRDGSKDNLKIYTALFRETADGVLEVQNIICIQDARSKRTAMEILKNLYAGTEKNAVYIAPIYWTNEGKTFELNISRLNIEDVTKYWNQYGDVSTELMETPEYRNIMIARRIQEDSHPQLREEVKAS